MVKPIPQPGEYSLSELSDAFVISRTTAERYIDRYALETLTLNRYKKQVQGVKLSQEIIDRILDDNPQMKQQFTGVSPQGNQDGDALSERINDLLSRLEEERTRYNQELNTLQNRSEQEHSRYQSEIGALNERFERERTTYMSQIAALNEQIQSLQHDLSDSRVKLAQVEAEKAGFTDKVRLLEARIADKEGEIESVRMAHASEKARADAFNNQIRAGNDLVLAQKTADAQFRELLTQIQALQQKAEQDGKPQNKAKGFRFMGFEISKPKG